MTPKIIFSSLTHEEHSCKGIPYGTACVAAYAKEKFRDSIEVEVFKYPDELTNYLEKNVPAVVCFSIYIWNRKISYQFAERIKRHYPETITVFGGPNYPLEKKKQKEFLIEHPDMDFYIFRDGELAFCKLLVELKRRDFNARKLKLDNILIDNCHYVYKQKIYMGETKPSLSDINELPSPYLTGLCDKFLQRDSIPLIQTTRGCPFTCAYCQEGNKYFHHIVRFPQERIRKELEYIAKRTSVPNLLLADSNFGMYKEDLDTCKIIAEIQKKYDWPKYIDSLDGKNNKERILKSASIIKGAMIVAAVQSTDKKVLKNIKRQNVSNSQMVQVAKEGVKSGANSFSEVILCLPGDTKKAHFKSVFDLIDSEINVVRSHQLIILSCSEIGTEKFRKKYGMKTKFRVIPKTISRYKLFEESFISYEIDEICVENNTMSFADYLECRRFDLTIEIFYNDNIFQELLKFLKRHDIPVSSFIMDIHKKTSSPSSLLYKLYNRFLVETEDLWPDKNELEKALLNPQIAESYFSGKTGNNEQLMYRALAVFNFMDELHKVAFDTAGNLLKQKGLYSTTIKKYLSELRKFNSLRKKDILKLNKTIIQKFHFDFVSLLKNNFETEPISSFCEDGYTVRFEHTEDQKKNIKKYLAIYGSSNYGLGNILSNVSHVSKLYRNVSSIP